MPTTNTNGSPNGTRDSLSDYEFSFETYLDYTSRIEIDVSLRQKMMELSLLGCLHS
jgi:hypothetical protein